jgi:hypothetical protein
VRYEHLVAVNDLNDPASFSLSRAQLWQGLLLRVNQPGLFVPGVERVSLLEQSESYILREMWLGSLLVRDHIHLQADAEIRFETEAGAQHRGGCLALTVEEPDSGMLFVRFRYEIPASDDPEDAQYESYLQEMWRQVDVESVRLIRDVAESGRLEADMH